MRIVKYKLNFSKNIEQNVYEEYYRKNKYYYNQDGSLNEIWEIGQSGYDFFRVHKYYYHAYGSLSDLRYFSARIEDQDTIFNTSGGGVNRSEFLHDESITSDKIKFTRNRFSDNFFDLSHYFENHMLTSKIRFEGGTWSNPETITNKNEYFYSEIDISNAHEINSYSSNYPVLVYPNPASSFLQFESDLNVIGSDLQLFDLKGNLISRYKLTTHRINITSLSSGLYLYQIEKNGLRQIGKIVVDKSK